MYMQDIDYRAELEKYSWTRPKWSSDKLIAASPFRYDKTPSFFVTLTGEYAGCFGDSGAYDAEWAGGNFTKLLSFLRNETYEETEEYLRYEYGLPDNQTDLVTLKPINLRIQRSRQSLSADILAQYTEDYTYLKIAASASASNGKWASFMIRKARRRSFRGTVRTGLANVKYRKVYGKTFWYQKGGRPIRELVYGIESGANNGNL
jgi:hypothetical protein